MSVLKITAANFEELVLKSEKPVLLDFWAPWCGPCRMIAPIVEKIAETRPDVTVGKVNVDDEMELAVRFGIVSIPTILKIEKGEVTAKVVGYLSEEELLGHLEL